MIIPVVQCAVCGHPVERWETWQDFSDWSWRFRVECHGETEECSLDHVALAETDKIIDAVAFKRLSLTNGTRGGAA